MDRCKGLSLFRGRGGHHPLASILTSCVPMNPLLRHEYTPLLKHLACGFHCPPTSLQKFSCGSGQPVGQSPQPCIFPVTQAPSIPSLPTEPGLRVTGLFRFGGRGEREKEAAERYRDPGPHGPTCPRGAQLQLTQELGFFPLRSYLPPSL